MTQQTINIGAGQDDGTGDPLRVAFDKCNDNFTDLYTGAAGIADVVEDITPQLGGNLDVNSNSIVSTGGANINITPDTTGNVALGTLTFDADQTVGAGQDNYVLTYDDASGTMVLEAVAVGGSDLEVEDEGISLSVAVTKINFVGDGVIATEPVGDEITVTIPGTVVANSLYCPGYIFVFVNTTDFKIENVQATSTFKPGALVSFYDTVLDTTVGGRILTSDFNVTSAGDTYVTMNMDGVEVLTANILEACFPADVLTWDPSPNLPFGGDAILDVAVGDFGGDHYTYVVGGSGNIAYSIDGCITWTQIVNTRTEGFNQIAYSATNQTFIAGGDAGLLAKCVDGVNWTYDDTSVPALNGFVAPNYNVTGLVYQETNGMWQLSYNANAAPTDAMAYSGNNGVSWLQSAAQYGNDGAHTSKLSEIPGSTQVVYGIASGALRTLTSPTTTSGASLDTAPASVISMSMLSTIKYAMGLINGNLETIPDGRYNSYLGNGFGPAVLDLAYSPGLNRYVAACAGGEIQWISANAGFLGAAMTQSNHSFTPGTDINCITYDGGDGVFTAGSASGQIARSITGL